MVPSAPKELTALITKPQNRFKWMKNEIINWKSLKSERKKEYRNESLEHSIPPNPSWTVLAEAMRKAAKTVCGVEDKKSRLSQWMIGHEEEAESYKLNIQRLVGLRNTATEQRNEKRITEIVEAIKRTRKEYKKKLKEWEHKLWDKLVDQCEEARRKQDMG